MNSSSPLIETEQDFFWEKKSSDSSIIFLDNTERNESETESDFESDIPQSSHFSQLKLLNTVDKIVGFTPDITYISGMSINLFSQDIFSKKESLLDLSPNQTRLGIDLWNEIDSVCAIYYGLRLLADKNHYKRKTKVIQGILNIITGVTMGYFTDNKQICLSLFRQASSTILASPVFALATACDLLNVSIDLYHTSQELDFKGWLTQRLEELDFIEERIRQESFAKNNAELSILNSKKEQLYFQITHRSIARSDEACSIKHIETVLKNKYPDLWNHCTHYSPEMVSQAKIIDQKIQQQINERYEAQRKIVLMKALSFVGMTLLAVATFVTCPPLLVVGSAICTLVALYYLQKNTHNLFSFFKDYPKNSEPKKIIQPLEPACCY